jgi:hypothetical protein
MYRPPPAAISVVGVRTPSASTRVPIVGSGKRASRIAGGDPLAAVAAVAGRRSSSQAAKQMARLQIRRMRDGDNASGDRQRAVARRHESTEPPDAARQRRGLGWFCVFAACP